MFVAVGPEARGETHSNGPKRSAPHVDRDLQKLVTEGHTLLEAAWCKLLDTPRPAAEFPVKSRTVLLDSTFTCSNTSATLVTMRHAVFFRRFPSVFMLSSSFVTYADTFLSALSVH